MVDAIEEGKVMAVTSKTRNIFEGLVNEGSFKWLLGNWSSFGDDFEDMGRSPSSRRNWIPELSTIANMVVRRCSSNMNGLSEHNTSRWSC